MRTILRLILAAVWLHALCAGADAAGRPNIVFIYCDDLAPWAVGASGYSQTRTPNLDRLFKEGAYLKNAMTTTPVCSPSRAGMMASRYGTELGIFDWINNNVEPNLGLDPATVIWPEVLAKAGYTNGLFGKWHLGELEKYHPTKNGYHHFMGFLGGGNAPLDPTLEVNGQKEKVPGFISALITDDAMKFVREHRAGPFLVSLHFREPHAPYAPVAEEDSAPFKDLDPAIPNPEFPDLDVERVKKLTREYLASVTSVDRHVGRLLALLDELQLRDNTVVIFSSDHGYNVGHNGVLHKGNGVWITNRARALPAASKERLRPNMYDNSLRVPTAVRWPGVIRPETTLTQVISNLDWYPTVLAMAGAELPQGETIRGRNFLPLLKGETVAWDNEFYAQYNQQHNTKTYMRALRTPEWKLVRDFLNAGKDELYHLAVDPDETTNLIESTESEAVQARQALHARLLERMKSIKDPVLPVATAAGN
jgi:choline-sulfatase